MQGKTDVALLAVLRVLDQNRVTNSNDFLGSTVNMNSFKIVYVYVINRLMTRNFFPHLSAFLCSAPMKALASEITQKFRKRLHWLSIKVRELTGTLTSLLFSWR
jgi:antiviral helicase SLH1